LAGLGGVDAPVEPHLEGDHDAGDHADREPDREDPPPEPEHLPIDGIPCPPVHSVQGTQQDRQPDGDGRERHVEHHRDGELPSREIKQTQRCLLTPRLVASVAKRFAGTVPFGIAASGRP
jgi:hypothetical protein